MVAVEEERCIWKVGLKFVSPECAPVKVWDLSSRSTHLLLCLAKNGCQTQTQTLATPLSEVFSLNHSLNDLSDHRSETPDMRRGSVYQAVCGGTTPYLLSLFS
ncbi:hypothetical protein RRG08_011121 [Elysia crispata]|uniref:Uncharacterized protein n=1 Tax=Elysia crispata TaxID=231223 RepID=A0AAE1A246_9GAST|nr:hypothetical protein RRG08_011121 [Elysia crispata]